MNKSLIHDLMVYSEDLFLDIIVFLQALVSSSTCF